MSMFCYAFPRNQVIFRDVFVFTALEEALEKHISQHFRGLLEKIYLLKMYFGDFSR